MLVERLAKLGYIYQPAPLKVMSFHSAVVTGSLVFTSGQVPVLGSTAIKGKVGRDVDLNLAKKAAEICAFNCICAAGAVVDVSLIKRAIKVFGMVNVAEGFDQTSEVINGATEFLNALFYETGTHARSAVGLVVPANWAVEVEMVFEFAT